MTRSELLDALRTRSILVAGVDPSKTLGTILWRHRDQLGNIPRQGYWVKEVTRELLPAQRISGQANRHALLPSCFPIEILGS